MIQPGCAVKALSRVTVSCGAACLLVSKGVVVQRLQYVARFVGDQPRAALRVCVYVPGLSFFAFANLQSHSIGGVYVSSFFPRSAVVSCALQHDFAVGARCVQHPLGFPGVVALLPDSADASSQGVVAVANSGVAALNFGEPVVGAPAVVNGLLRGLLLDEVAACIPAVGDGEAGQAAARGVANLAAVAARLAQPGELAFGAVAVAGDEAAWLAVFGDVAGAVVDAGAHAAQRVGFLREVAKGVVLALGGAPQRVGDAGFVVVGVVLVAGDAACCVGDLGDVAACVIAVGGGAAVAALDGLLAFACGAFTMGDLHAVAGCVGLLDEAAGAVVFGFELQSPRRVAVAA